MDANCLIQYLLNSPSRLPAGGGPEGPELYVWDTRRGERIVGIGQHPGVVYSVAWGASEEFLICGSAGGTIRWWELVNRKCLVVHDAHQGTVQSLRRSPDGTILASCGEDGSIRLWDLQCGKHLATLRRDRPYERLNISGIKGLTEAQEIALQALGAIGEPEHTVHYVRRPRG